MVGVGEEIMTTGNRGLLAGEVATELSPINLIPIDTGIIHFHGSMQIGIQFPSKSDDLGMPP